MLRWGILIVILGLVAYLAASLAEFPGAISLTWRDWRIDTSLGVFVAAMLVVCAIVALAYRLWWSLRKAPRMIERARLERRHRLGYEALSRGLVAVGAGGAAAGRRPGRDAFLYRHARTPRHRVPRCARPAGAGHQARRLERSAATRRTGAPAQPEERLGRFHALRPAEAIRPVGGRRSDLGKTHDPAPVASRRGATRARRTAAEAERGRAARPLARPGQAGVPDRFCLSAGGGPIRQAADRRRKAWPGRDGPRTGVGVQPGSGIGGPLLGSAAKPRRARQGQGCAAPRHPQPRAHREQDRRRRRRARSAPLGRSPRQPAVDRRRRRSTTRVPADGGAGGGGARRFVARPHVADAGDGGRARAQHVVAGAADGGTAAAYDGADRGASAVANMTTRAARRRAERKNKDEVRMSARRRWPAAAPGDMDVAAADRGKRFSRTRVNCAANNVG